MRKLTKTLIDKSKDSFLLALELFNKPTIGYRTESFSILFSNAWELLLKAYLYETSGGKKQSIFRKKIKNQKRESITIDECLNKIFTKSNDPVRKNIEYISEIRNEAAHLIIAALDPYFSRVFQRGVLNYIELLDKWFAVKLAGTFKPGLISLISDEGAVKNISTLKKSYSKEDFQYINDWVKKFKALERIGDKATIPITYSIAIVNNPNKADVILSSGGKGVKAVILEKYRDIDQTHPFRRKDAIEEIISRLKTGQIFTPYDFEAYCFVNGMKKSSKNEYYWKPKYGSGQYSGKLTDVVVTFFNSNPGARDNLRNQYSEHLKRKRKQSMPRQIKN